MLQEIPCMLTWVNQGEERLQQEQSNKLDELKQRFEELKATAKVITLRNSLGFVVGRWPENSRQIV